MFAQLFLEERKALYTLSEQFIPLVVPLQKPDQLNQLLWLKTAHPACQEAGRIFFFSCFVYKFKNGAVLRQQDQPSLFPLFPVFYNPNDGNTGENLYILSKEKVYFLFSWFSISVLRQYTQPGQVSVVQRPSEKLSGTGCYLPFENTPLEKFFQIRILWGMQQRSILPPPLTPPGN